MGKCEICTLILILTNKPFTASRGSSKLVEILLKKETGSKHFFDLENYKKLK